MDLFSDSIMQANNILPIDGIVNYYGIVFPTDLADQYYGTLIENIEWKHDQANMFGKIIHTKRKVGWYGDKAFTYTYSKVTKLALPWTPALKELKARTEEITGYTYNSCLLNLYHDGSEGMAWHSDGEKDLQKDGAIASLSFGAERKFAFKHKETKEKVDIVLQHGSLLVMRGATQSNWLHRLPPTKKVNRPRVNLTFRTIVRQ